MDNPKSTINNRKVKNMKRTFKSLLAAAALAFAGISALINPSSALATTPDIRNSVQCNRYDGGSFPANSRYYDCTYGAPYTSYNGTAQTTILNILNSAGYPQVAPVLQQGTGTKFWIFNNAVDAKAWFTYPTVWGTLAQKQAEWTAQKGNTAGSFDPTSTESCDVRIFVGVGSGLSYPTVTIQTNSQYKNTVAHEIGHCFNALWNAPTSYTRLSDSSMFVSLYAKDLAYMQANDPNYATNISTFGYWLNDRDELFAEEFARTEVGAILPVDNNIAAYWGCTLKYTQTWMKSKRNPTASEFTAAGLSRCN